MRQLLKRLWCQRQEWPVEPMVVDFPPGVMRLVFLNVDVAPTVIVWCRSNSVMSSGVVAETNEVEMVLNEPAIALGVLRVPDEALLTQVYVDDQPMAHPSTAVLASGFDLSRRVVVFVPWWRVVVEWIVHLIFRLRYGKEIS